MVLVDAPATGGDVRLSHPLYGEVVRSALPVLRSRELRLRLAAAVQERDRCRPTTRCASRAGCWTRARDPPGARPRRRPRRAPRGRPRSRRGARGAGRGRRLRPARDAGAGAGAHRPQALRGHGVGARRGTGRRGVPRRRSGRPRRRARLPGAAHARAVLGPRSRGGRTRAALRRAGVVARSGLGAPAPAAAARAHRHARRVQRDGRPARRAPRRSGPGRGDSPHGGAAVRDRAVLRRAVRARSIRSRGGCGRRSRSATTTTRSRSAPGR